jgi:hypothetical protein
MEMTQPGNRIHPLMAGAAISVILVSLLGAAALTGVLPNVHASATPAAPVAAQAPVIAPPSAFAQQITPPVVVAPQDHGDSAVHRTVVRHYPAAHAQPPSASPSYAQASTYAQQPPTTQAAYSQVPPAAPQSAPATQYSPVGIGVGAVVGGLLGNQIGNGNGKTLATIAGALGGGYLGNEIAKRTP